MFCHKCGEQLAEGASFCHKCGTKIVYADNNLYSVDTSAAANEHEESNMQVQNGAAAVQKIEIEHTANSDREDFKMFVDNHVRETTKYQSADDLLTNSKPWRFIWPCIIIPSVMGGLMGKDMDIQMGWLLGLLIFGCMFGYGAAFIASGIIRMRYREKFSGRFDQNINHEKLLLFLDENMGRVSPYFHEFGYLTQEGVLAVVENILSNTSNRTMLCCEFGPRKKSLATICIRPDSEAGQMLYIVDAVRNGFLMDGRAAGFLAHACLIRTAPILQAAMEYYLKNCNEEG